MGRVIGFLVKLFSLILNLFRGKEKMLDNKKDEIETKLLSPKKHTRYISIYCVADLSDGDKEIFTVSGELIHSISNYSYKRLVMEGTGRLSDGRVVNVAKVVSGFWRFSVMGEDSPNGVGIRGAALVPWVSLAHELSQLKQHDLFNREIIIPSMVGYELPDGSKHDGRFRVTDTGGGLRRAPYENGLWRTGSSHGKCGQFDLFIGGPESLYKKLLGTWDSYKEVIVMPRGTEGGYGIQESLNLLIDAGLSVDGIVGPKTKEAIKKLQIKLALTQTGEWDKQTKEYVEKSLENWYESI